MMKLSPDGCLMNTYCAPLNFVGQSVSVDEKIKSSLGIYPNPANDIITVNYPESINGRFYVIDMVGQVHVQSAATGSGLMDIDISALPVGSYRVQLVRDRRGGESFWLGSFVKM